MQVKTALQTATELLSESDSAALDAEVLLCLVLQKQRSYLRAWPNLELPADLALQFRTLIEQRQQGTPIAYLTGNREFWSRDFKVTPDVLIPRADTELLIELCLTLIPSDKPCKIIDLGTGSGIIAITLAAERPLAQLTGIDISLAALSVAKLNAINHSIPNVQFHQSDWFTSVPDDTYQIIVSNPPYIAEDDEHLKRGDLRFEPRSALSAAESGLSDIRIITKTAYSRLDDGGYLLVEHGYDQQQQVQKLFNECHYQQVQTINDLAGLARVTYGQRLNTPNQI
ncbi:MAG: peptide chain release factor N(5)-glutamine methyltransferase [Methylococcales bacterium]|nr:MAG: peptide chain release factor N(5)-glutamine methyltransferase [Methylococcales bacterium]